MRPEGQREFVRASVRRRLPEFAERNGVVLSEEVMDNLSYWVLGTIPAGYARVTCSGRLPERDAPGWACACTGMCQAWLDVSEEAG